MPARGCAGPAMGLLHMGQTQRTSSHFTRHLRGRNTGGWDSSGRERLASLYPCTHLLWKACWHGSTPSSSFTLKSSRQTAQVCCGR